MAPTSVVSADQIHFTAQTTIPDVLNFVPGVDVSRVDRESFAVGVHGLNNVFADRTLTLINGRDDRVVHYENSLHLLAQIPDSRAVLLNRCGHWAQIEHAAEFNRLVGAFVAG